MATEKFFDDVPPCAHGIYFAAHRRLITSTRIQAGEVLDLGCGSTLEGHPPYLARWLHGMGIKVTGVDLFPNSGELFNVVQGDVTDPGVFDRFREGQFIIIHENALTDKGNTCPHFEDSFRQFPYGPVDQDKLGDFYNGYNGRIAKILNSEGVYIRHGADPEFWKKEKNGKLYLHSCAYSS